MINGKDYEYLWNHEDEYERINSSEMDNDGALSLCETILMEIGASNKRILHSIKQEPRRRELHKVAKERLELLRTMSIDAISMGHGDEIADEFELQLSKLGININKEDADKYEDQIQLHLQRLEKGKKPLQNYRKQTIYRQGTYNGVQEEVIDIGTFPDTFVGS